MKTFSLDNIQYTAEFIDELRNKAIELRDGALQQAQFDWVIALSHIIAVLAKVVEELKKVEEELRKTNERKTIKGEQQDQTAHQEN